jgi:hypothetical protein
VEGRIRPIEQYVAVMVSVFSENIIKTMSAEKTLLCIKIESNDEQRKIDLLLWKDGGRKIYQS